MLKPLVLAGAALTAAVPVGKAADVGAPPAYDWSGGYIDAYTGYGPGNLADGFNSNDIFGNLAGEAQSGPLDGLIGGSRIGHNWQIDNYILGLEGTFTWAGLKEKTGMSGLGFYTGVDWLAALTPRFGIAFDDLLVYGKGGLALGDLGTLIEQPVVRTDDATEVGWTVGAGAEVALSENWIIGVEGDYYDFGTYSDVANLPATSRPGTNDNVEASLWTILARISYKFGE